MTHAVDTPFTLAKSLINICLSSERITDVRIVFKLGSDIISTIVDLVVHYAPLGIQVPSELDYVPKTLNFTTFY